MKLKISGSKHTEWSTGCRQILKVNLEIDTHAIRASDSRDRALDISSRITWVVELRGRECSRVDDSRRVVLDDRSVSLNAGDGIGGCLCGDERDEDSQED